MAGRLSTALQNRLAGITTELNSNSAFAANADDWTAVTATKTWSATGGVSNGGCVKVSAAAGYIHKNFTGATHKIQPGQLYKLSVNYTGTNGTGGYPKVTVGTSAGNGSLLDSGNLTGTTSQCGSQYVGYFTAPESITDWDVFVNLHTTDTGEQLFDNVSLVCMSHSIQDCMKYSRIMFYTGTQPADPDDAPTGTLLCTVLNVAASPDNGITWEDATDGVISQTSGETWQGDCVADGTVGWFRVCTYSDSLASDSVAKADCRIDGSVSTSGGQINFPSLAFANGATQTVTDLQLTVKYQA